MVVSHGVSGLIGQTVVGFQARRLRGWQRDREGGSLARCALGLYTTAVTLDCAVAYSEAQTHPRHSLGCEERLEDLLANLAAHTNAAVGEVYKHRISLCFGCYSETAALRHGIQRVEDDVDEHFSQLGRRAAHHRKGCLVDLDGVPKPPRSRLVVPFRLSKCCRVLDD